MKILHTSDWHLGLMLGEHDRLHEQRLFLEWLVERACELSINALLVSGDVYDVVNPSLAAQTLFADFVVKFYAAMPTAQLVVIAGNHDSAARLELPKPFGEALGRIHLVGQLDVSSAIIPLRDRQGKACAWCLAVPYLRPSDLDCKVLDGETVDETFIRAVTSLYSSLKQKAQQADSELPIISMGHLTVAGSARAGAERSMIGGVESIPVSAVADGMDYVALGHIHRSQKLGADHVRYCGSPYAVNFDEHSAQHQILLIELAQAGGGVIVTSLAVPRVVDFLRFPKEAGTLAQVQESVQQFDWKPYERLPRDLRPFVLFCFVSSEQATDLRKGVENLCSQLPIRYAGVTYSNALLASNGTIRIEHSDLRSLDAPTDVFLKHMERQQIQVPSPVLACFREAVAHVQMQGGAA